MSSLRLTAGTLGFRRAGVGLLAAAFLAPFSASRIAGSVTVGRTVAVVFALLVGVDLLRARAWEMRFERATVLAGAAYVSLFAWILVNSLVWGCDCDGKLGGFAEFAFVGTLALVAISLEPRLRRVAMLAVLAGITLAAVLALVGVGSINSGTVDLTQTGGRLSGTYGNANELGFALALGIPIALAYLPVAQGRKRIALGAAAVVLVVALILTYSRGGIIAATVGTVAVALWLARGDRRKVKIILAATAASVLVAAVLYSVFERERREASFTPVSPTLQPLDQRDLSDWDSRALGPIPQGHSLLSNRRGEIAVRSRRAGEGASYRWGEAADKGTYTLRFRARAAGERSLRLSYALGDSTQALAGRFAAEPLGSSWRRFKLVWRPRLRAPHASLYLWQRSGHSTFLLADVSVIARVPGRPSHRVSVPSRLKGSIYGHTTALAAKEESRYIRSRLDAARVAVRAFGSSPLWGIGWGTFPEYASEHLDYGQLAAHDEYLAFAAELGIIGLALLGLLVAGAVVGVRGVGAGRAETAAIGALAAAAAGFVFVEALPVPQLSVPLAMALAVVCGRQRKAAA